LQLRRERAATFGGTSYRALIAEGAAADAVVAFARDDIVVAVPRLVRSRLREGLHVDLAGGLPVGTPGCRYRSAIDGSEIAADAGGTLDLARVFGGLPLTVLVPVAPPAPAFG
jgi:maltooligosyltrehalose synthase